MAKKTEIAVSITRSLSADVVAFNPSYVEVDQAVAGAMGAVKTLKDTLRKVAQTNQDYGLAFYKSISKHYRDAAIAEVGEDKPKVDAVIYRHYEVFNSTMATVWAESEFNVRKVKRSGSIDNLDGWRLEQKPSGDTANKGKAGGKTVVKASDPKNDNTSTTTLEQQISTKDKTITEQDKHLQAMEKENASLKEQLAQALKSAEDSRKARQLAIQHEREARNELAHLENLLKLIEANKSRTTGKRQIELAMKEIGVESK